MLLGVEEFAAADIEPPEEVGKMLCLHCVRCLLLLRIDLSSYDCWVYLLASLQTGLLPLGTFDGMTTEEFEAALAEQGQVGFMTALARDRVVHFKCSASKHALHLQVGFMTKPCQSVSLHLGGSICLDKLWWLGFCDAAQSNLLFLSPRTPPGMLRPRWSLEDYVLLKHMHQVTTQPPTGKQGLMYNVRV
jgi:hypothetical protein